MIFAASILKGKLRGQHFRTKKTLTMKHLQIFVILLLIALCVALKDRKGGNQKKRFPKPLRFCSSDSDCPEFAKCLKKDFREKGICLPKKMIDGFEKKVAKLSLLKACSGDTDCTGFDKCSEVPKIGIRMCMPEMFGKMLQKKITRLPAKPKTCVSEAECTDSTRCIEFPKFEKQMCLYENGRFHKILKILHDRFTMEKKNIPDLKKNEELEKNSDQREDSFEKKDVFDKDDSDKEPFEKKDPEYKNDEIDKEKFFISDPQFLTNKKNGKENFEFSERSMKKKRNHPWSMFFMGALAMTGVFIILLTAGMCCLKLRARKDENMQNQERTASNLTRNAFLSNIGTISKNPYSKLENEKI